MLKACKYCGKIHDKKEICSKKPVYERGNEIDRFRWTQAWKDKREEIKKRDLYLCQACLHNMSGTTVRLNTSDLSVHHIRPLRTNFDMRLDDGNLITLCNIHHELAEKGTISAKELIEILPPTV